MSDFRRKTKIERAKSAGQAAAAAPGRFSPPDQLPPSLSAEPLSPTTPNGITPPSPTIATPPKKTWERHYRSFLTRKFLSNSPGASSTTQGDSSEDGSVSSSSVRNFFPGSKRLLAQRPSSEKSVHRKNANLDGATIPPMPVLPKTKSSGDMAVRGGNFFHSVFQKDRHHAGPPPVPDDSSKLSPRRRRNKSADDLDSTLRGGHEKMYSKPKFKEPSDTEGEVVHGGVVLASHRASNLPSALAGSAGGSKAPQSTEMKKAFTTFHNSAKFAHDASSAYLGDDPSIRSKTQSTEMKKAFTTFHNSATFAPDSTSAYLGDEPSVRENNYFAMYNQAASLGRNFSQSDRNYIRSSDHRLSTSLPLDTVDEDYTINRSMRILRMLQGPEAWENGRRYLIAPAALSSCPLQVLSILSGSTRYIKDYSGTPFGVVELGTATVSYVGQKRHNHTLGWSSCMFMLRQNYLMEYDADASMHGTPRGFAHLEHSKCYPHHDFQDALELEFFASPCAKSDKRVLFLRVESRAERDRWVTCLNDAAHLTIKDLYDFDEKTEFGRGRYAAVYPARRREGDEGTETDSSTKPFDCALKVIDKNEFWRRVVKGMERADTLVREASVQATLTAKCGRLPTLLKIRSLFETSDNVVMELELLEGTDLFRYVSSKGSLHEDEAARIMRDVLTSLDAICRVGVAHRDIKPANILMCNEEKDGVTVKLGDFGMSTFVGVDGLVRGRCGTPGYVAPEIFSAGVNVGYGNKVDVFSAGVTLYVMLCGYEPFYGESDAELIAANKEAAVDFPASDWDKVSTEARDLVMKMMEPDPSKRIDAKTALQHPWIRNQAPSSSWSELTESIHRMTLSAADVPDGTACTIA